MRSALPDFDCSIRSQNPREMASGCVEQRMPHMARQTMTHQVWMTASIFAVLLPQFTLAEDRRTDPSRLVVMTFNGEFLWDGETPEEGQVNFPWKGSPSEARDHMERVADVIRKHNPDILNLVEVENIEALTLLRDQFLSDLGYQPYLKKGGDSYTGQDVALLTRIDPVGGDITYDQRKGRSGDVEKSVSKNYVARFEPTGIKFALIGLHLLAQPNREDRRLQREAQADAIRSMAKDQAAQGYEVIVLGDFNDYDGESASLDHIDSTPITNVLTIIRSMGTSSDADDLVNACRLIPKPARFTAFWDKDDDGEIDAPHEFTSIDHVLVSPGLFTKIESVEAPHGGHDPRQVSDHFPVFVRFRVGTPGSPPGTANSLRITRLLPNPPGNENQNEKVWIKNIGTSPIALTGYRLRDLAGKEWNLDSVGTITPGEEKEIQRNGQPMAMNNDGDTIELRRSSGDVLQTVSYGAVDEGEEIEVAN